MKYGVTFHGPDTHRAIGVLTTHGIQTIIPTESGDPQITSVVAVVHADDAASAWHQVTETLGEGYTLFAVAEAEG
jgi:hypothetical protein